MSTQVTEHTIEVPGRGKAVVRDHRGPLGAPALFLLHGLGATGALNWGRCYPALERHFRVLSIDHRGHGRGFRTRRFRLEQCADDVAAVVDRLDVDRVIPVGYSMGGPIASLAWRRHPDLVDGLVLCATARHFASRALSRLARASLPAASVALRLVPSLVHQRATHRMVQSVEHPELRDYVRSELLGHDPATIVQAAEAVTSFHSHDWIGDVDVPTAVVVTTLDELVPALRQRKLADSIQGAEVFEVAGDHDACVASPAFAPTLVRACRSVAQRAARRSQRAPLPAQAATA
jgi:pimeloyl-ACP methyl ester carboxylesterase